MSDAQEGVELPILAAEFCIQPAEVYALSRGEGDQIRGTIEAGCGLTFSFLLPYGESFAPGTQFMEMSRSQAVGLRDALTHYLDDGHHTHVGVNGDLERRPDHGVAGGDVDTSAPFEIPDTLEGLGINTPPQAES